jgi:hypothetical protein
VATNAPSNDAGASSAETGEAGAGGKAATTPTEAEECRPTSGKDEPDDDFVDSNCDGIDGDVKHAVFVSPDGFDSEEGSAPKPVQSLRRALELAKDGARDVYVCTGTYRENVVIEAPVSIYGGYDCERGWKRTKDVAIFQAGAGLPLLVKNVDGKVRLERLAFRAPTSVKPGQSSQAAAIVGSSNVQLADVELKTGHGSAGLAGRPGGSGHRPQPASAAGVAAALSECTMSAPAYRCDVYASGGYSAAATQRCAEGFEMRGGRGGVGGNVWLANGEPGCLLRGRDPGGNGLPGQYRTGDGDWQDVAADGAMGADGADGLSPALGVGALADGLYMASNAGTDGAIGGPGLPGRGGHGGYSTGHAGDVCGPDYRVGSGGGQGALGGCGGGGATGGGAGGGAVALVVVGSAVKITNARFVVGDGGDGAEGGTGQLGASGASGGAAYLSTYQGQPGQLGGNGGQGGDGGPGGGGPAIAVLFTGAAPEVIDAVYEIGVPGIGGQAFSGPNGPTGATGEVLSLDELLGKKP